LVIAGKRKFVTCGLEEFWKTYERLPSSSRHYYEVIRESTPCNLYFDLEYSRTQNQHLVELALLQQYDLSQLQDDEDEDENEKLNNKEASSFLGSTCYVEGLNEEILRNQIEEEMLETFIRFLCHQLFVHFNVHVDRTHIIDLDSSSPEKFSRHLVCPSNKVKML
jgi:hypothetical protein